MCLKYSIIRIRLADQRWVASHLHLLLLILYDVNSRCFFRMLFLHLGSFCMLSALASSYSIGLRIFNGILYRL